MINVHQELKLQSIISKFKKKKKKKTYPERRSVAAMMKTSTATPSKGTVFKFLSGPAATNQRLMC